MDAIKRSEKILIDKINSLSFAAVELRLFLDTHPCNTQAMEEYRSVLTKLDALKKEYSEASNAKADCCRYATTPFPWVND